MELASRFLVAREKWWLRSRGGAEGGGAMFVLGSLIEGGRWERWVRHADLSACARVSGVAKRRCW